MKAITFSRYGNPEVLDLNEVERPWIKAGEVLVKIHATSVNDWDWSLVRGKPYLYRLMFGLLFPKIKVPGAEIAGVVEAVDKSVTKFKVGDRVFGDTSIVGLGGFAEYGSYPETVLAIMPHNVTFHKAASLPHASLLAWQGLVDIGGIKEGEKVLINGAGGGVGTLGVQIANLYKCQVTGLIKALNSMP